MSATSLLDQFRQAIVSAGLTPPDVVVADGRLHRFASNGDPSDDSGWYVLFSDGTPAGCFGDWRSDLKQNWCAKSDRQLSEAERAEHRRRIEEARRQRDQEERRRHAEVASWAQQLWEQAPPATDDHPYLLRKKVRAHGLRLDGDGDLVLPVWIDGTLTSLQSIPAGEGQKKQFLPGGQVRRGSFTFGDLSKGTTILIAEGFATSASLHECTSHPTVCAFFAHNLQPVAEQLAQQFPTATILICGDNDIHEDGKPNAGLVAATAAAKAVNGLLAIPELRGKKCDWNDFAQARGLAAVKEALETVVQGADNTTITTTAVTTTETQPDSGTAETTAEPTRPPFQVVTPPESFVTQYIRYAAMRTDAPLEAHEALGFGVLSALAGPAVTLPIATSVKGWRLTLWLLYLVNSTVGRKSTTLDLAVDVVREVLGETALIHWEGSPQGLLQRLQPRDGQASVFVRDEYSGLMAAMNRGGHLAGLPQLLIKGFDGSVLENVRVRKRGPDGETHSDSDHVDNPYLVQFAAAPWDAFTERATIDNVFDGFLARFVIVMGSAAERGLPMITEEIRAAGTAVYGQAQRYYDRAQTIQQTAIAPGVLARQWRLEQDYRRKAEASARPDAAGPSLKRLAETALKLTALLALEEATGTVLSLREEHFVIATRITDRWAGNALRLVEALGRTTFQRDCERVLRTIQQHPAGLPKGHLYRFHQRLRQRDFEEILNALEMQERIEIVKPETTGKGRPPIIVRVIKGV